MSEAKKSKKPENSGSSNSKTKNDNAELSELLDSQLTDLINYDIA